MTMVQRKPGASVNTELPGPRSRGSVGDASASEIAERVRVVALQRGLLFEPAGRDGSVARLLPPLNLSFDEAREALAIFGAAVVDVAGAVMD